MPHHLQMATIDIPLQRLDQLFIPAATAPFHERALNRDAEAHIVEWAGELGSKEPLRLVIHAPGIAATQAAAVRDAIHAHFRLAHAQCRRRYRRRMRLGYHTLVAAFFVLAATLVLRALLGTIGQGPGLLAVSEGLLIIGWVAMWRPIQVLLYERLEEHANMALFQRLARCSVSVESEDAGTNRPDIDDQARP